MNPEDDLLGAMASTEPGPAEDAAPDVPPACTLEGVCVRADGSDILSGITLSIPRHACTVIMGPSGSGKSTLLRAAAGLIVPDTGHVTILGADPNRLPDRELERLRARSGFVFQDGALWQNLSLMQNLSLPLQHHRPDLDSRAIAARIDQLVKELGATSSLALRPAQVSAGEQKIVSFARGIVNNPELLFLDEPTTSVDGERADLMIRKLRLLKESRVTLISVTHNPRIASQLADYVVVLKQGKVLMFGSLHAVSRSGDPEIERILTDVLSETATYDGDILELLDPETNTYLT